MNIPSDLEDTMNRQANINALKDTNNIPYHMEKYCEENLKKLATQVIQIPLTQVKFQKLEPGTDGECYQLTIVLSEEFLTNFTRIVLNKWSNALRLANPNDYFDYSVMSNSIDLNKFKQTLFSQSLEPLVFSCASTFLHEIVHAFQNYKQITKGNSKIGYSSYLAPKKEFLAKMGKDNALSDPLTYKLYRASPQEMAGFANQDATRYIRDHGLDDPTQTITQKDLAELRHYIGDFFRDRTNHNEYKILKRYGKLVYTAIADYINRKAELNKNQ
jgi:hypothetical protein